MKYNIQLFVLLFGLTSQINQAQDYSFDKIPDWVKTINIPNESSITKYETTAGYYLKLADYQVNLEENTTFNHEVRNVVSYSGITNASQLLITYDTSYQHLKIHHLYIWRKGEKIDRTNVLSLEIMNNEYNLQQGIYSGKITAYDILNDIRKDDLIDFSYSLIGKNPIFENEKYTFIPLEGMSPIDLYTVRILYSKEKDYTYKCVGCDSINFSSLEVDGYKQIEIYIKNLTAIKYEDNIPLWSIPYKYFTLSSFKSWKDVNTWAQNVFALQKEPQLDIVFNEIFTGKETMDDKINKIINYVQDDIRYMGIESGIGSIKPFQPEQVVKQRFGDCKDKSLLLVSLLKKLGIKEAYPSLVNTIMKYKVDKNYPSNEVFNHCIVTFNYNNNTYWVDPSIALQGGGFKDLYNNDYGKVLIIGKPSDTLQTMSPNNTQGGSNIVEELTINSFTEPAQLKITSNQYGFEADNRRVLLEYYSINDLSKKVLNELKLLFPTVNKTNELIINDDIENNNFFITYNYEVDNFWQDQIKGTNETSKKFWVFKYEPLLLYHYLNVSACEERKNDYELKYPLNLYYKMIFHFPKKMLIYDNYNKFDNIAFCFEEKIEQLSSNSFQVDYNLKIKSNYIKAVDYKNICDQKNTIAKNLPILIYFEK